MGVWKEIKTILDRLREEAGEERKKGEGRGAQATVATSLNSRHVLAAYGVSAEGKPRHSLIELLQQGTHFYVLKIMNMCI